MEEKNQMKDNLMEIRACISIIDTINDENEKFNEMIQSIKDNEKNKDKEIKSIEKKIDELNESSKTEKEKIIFNTKDIEKSKSTTISSLILSILLAVAFIALAYFLIVYVYVDNLNWLLSRWNIPGIVIVVVHIGLLALGLVIAVGCSNFFGKFKHSISERKKLEKSILNSNDIISTNEINVKDYDESLKSSKEYFKTMKDADSNIIKGFKESISNNIKSMNDLYRKCVDKHGKFLDPSDWKNLDLVYYYLDTGRSDTIKESLQLLDQKKHTEAIIHEIRMAKDDICYKIESSTSRITNSLSRLTETVAQVGISMCESNKAIFSNISNLSEQISYQNELSYKQISALDVNNALQKKANRTMEDMLITYFDVNKTHSHLE